MAGFYQVDVVLQKERDQQHPYVHSIIIRIRGYNHLIIAKPIKPVRQAESRLETPQRLTALACGKKALVLPVPVRSRSAEEAFRVNALVRLSLDFLMTSFPETKVVILPEDMWRARPEMMRPRLLAQIGRFRSIFARNTSARRITGPEAAEFLKKCHTYSDAASRYRYGLFLGGTLLVAVATFSSARTWQKQEGVVRSYEWVRYASLPDVRVVPYLEVLGQMYGQMSRTYNNYGY